MDAEFIIASILILIVFYGMWNLWDKRRQAKTYHKIFLNETLLDEMIVREALSVSDMSTGLRNHHELDDRIGFLFKGWSLHTIGMNFEIDVIFLDKNGKILSVIDRCPINKSMIFGPFKTKKILELNQGRSSALSLTTGKVMKFES